MNAVSLLMFNPQQMTQDKHRDETAEHEARRGAIDRGERRDMPQTPWPLVQPDPYRVPMPTNTPAAISPSQPLLNSICGSAVNKPHRSGAMSRPRRNSASHHASPPRCKRLPIRPLMPAIRPLATTNRLAARPINAPPAKG
jgi:hypothetical protein